jgi:hypothetical protein
MPVVCFLGMAGHPCPTLRATSLSLLLYLQGEPADIGEGYLGPPVVPGSQEIGRDSETFAPGAEARPTGRAVCRERGRRHVPRGAPYLGSG